MAGVLLRISSTFYTDDDIRKKIFLYGQQYDASGNPMIYNGVNVVLDPYGFDAFDVGGADDKGRLVGSTLYQILSG